MKLPKTAKQIKNSKDFIDINGDVYTYISNYKGIQTDKVYKKAQHIVSGYKYCGIYDNKTGRCKQRRVHRLVAEAFIPNPQNLPIVGHKNNIKTDNRIENLYWTTNTENIQKAVDDGLLKNKKGYDDSQSKPVIMFNTTTNEIIGTFGSICEAVKETGLSKTTIARQAKYKRPIRKPYYFRYADDETDVNNSIIGKFDYDTDVLCDTYINFADAAKQNNISEKTVAQHCHKGKPKHQFLQYYFGYVNSKCEQTIES